MFLEASSKVSLGLADVNLSACARHFVDDVYLFVDSEGILDHIMSRDRKLPAGA